MSVNQRKKEDINNFCSFKNDYILIRIKSFW